MEMQQINITLECNDNETDYVSGDMTREEIIEYLNEKYGKQGWMAFDYV